MKFEGKTVLITGASSGIGKELAYQLSDQKCKLILIARRENLLQQISTDLSEKCEVITFKCDVADKEQVKSTYEKIINQCERIDLAFLNAAVSFKGIPGEINSNIGEETIRTNLFGQIYWIEQLLPTFKNQGSGTVAVVSSLADSRGFSGSGYYCASKAALTTYLEGLRPELSKLNIKLVNIKPGFVKTPMTDKNEFYMPFLMNVDKAVRIIIRGLEQEKNYIKFPLPTAIGAKILRCMPDFIFDFIAKRY